MFEWVKNNWTTLAVIGVVLIILCIAVRRRMKIVGNVVDVPITGNQKPLSSLNDLSFEERQTFGFAYGPIWEPHLDPT